jgi:hypothetical protein
VHFDEFDDLLRHEPDADAVISRNVRHYQDQVNALLEEVRAVTARLGVAPAAQQVTGPSGETANALVVLSSGVDTSAYKNALVEAKTNTLPELFKRVEEANRELARWMTATAMPTRAALGPMKESIKHVEDRIYTIELYAGLTEEAVKVKDGAPAATDERLRVMQRRLYMDEECLANYEAGGMEMKDIGQFDEWLSRGENLNRILPFPRCMAAFRVRRHEKTRDAGTLWQTWVNVHLARADEMTFLYVRNGAQLWRVNCDFDFGAKLVPDASDFDPSQPMMIKLFGHSVDRLIPRSAWEVMRDEELEQERLSAEWEEANPDEHWMHNPHRNSFHRHRDYHPFDPSSVYYDDALAQVNQTIKDYNRVAVILQGLFDRSPVLHPHPTVRVGDPESFARSVEVVYDSTTLTHGDAPDFEEYRAELNASITAESIVTGQKEVWLRREAARENERQANNWRTRDRSNYTRFQPHGDPGSGLVGPMAQWQPRARKAVFRWTRERRGYSYYKRDDIGCTLTVPASELLNVSAYAPGDYLRFFRDPRTRQQYLKWAPLLLTAEDYHAGKTSKTGYEV